MAEQYVDIPNLSLLRRLIGATAEAVLDPAFFARTGEYVRATVKVRTLSGTDADGVPFKPYSAKHALRRLLYGAQIDHVDLTMSNQMLGGMTQDVAKDQVRVFFLSTAAFDPITKKPAGVTNAAKAFFNHQKRPFFALSTDQVSHIVQDYSRVVKDALEDRRGV